MINLTAAHKRYRHGLLETHALRGLSMNVQAGEYVAVMGPSGSGKSTLLNLLGLLEAADSGAYHLDEQDVAALSDAERTALRARSIGFVFQAFNLIDDLTVLHNVEVPLIYRRLPASARAERAMAVLDRLGLSALARHRPAQLSGGQQQIVALARALVGKPALLLADEPTGNLDSLAAARVLAEIDRAHQHGTTVVMVTHSQEYANRAGRVLHLLDGDIDGALRPAQLRHGPH